MIMYKDILIVLTSAFILCLWLLPVLEKLARKKGLLTHQYPEKIDKRNNRENSLKYKERNWRRKSYSCGRRSP